MLDGAAPPSCASPSKNPRDQLSYVWSDRGIVLLNLGRYSTAAASFDKAIQLEPRDADAWRGKNLALRALGDVKGARNALAKARRLG